MVFYKSFMQVISYPFVHILKLKLLKKCFIENHLNIPHGEQHSYVIACHMRVKHFGKLDPGFVLLA